MVNNRHWVALASGVLLLATIACNEAGGDGVLGPGSGAAPPPMSRFAEAGEIPIEPGLSVGADPETIELNPCDPEAPTDPDTGKLLGKTTIGAFVRDENLDPLVGVEVRFVTSAGELESAGQPVLTDSRGLATDTLGVSEDDAGKVRVTVSSIGLEQSVVVPVKVRDRRPVELEMSPDELWPPNHRLRQVQAVFSGLECYPEVVVTLVSVTSSEPDNGTGDGNTTGDIQGAEIGTDDTTLMLRAERSGGGPGRVYTATYDLRLSDDETLTLSSTATVPHDRGH